MIFPTQLNNLKLLGIPRDHILYGSDGTFTPMPACIKLAEEMDQIDGIAAAYSENPKKLLEG